MFKSLLASMVCFMMASSAMALDFNPLVGVQVQAEDEKIGAESGLALGAEFITNNKIIFGASFSANKRDDLIGATEYIWGPAEVENSTVSLWVGKLFDNGFAAKVGYSHYASEMTVRTLQWGSDSVSGDQSHLLIGGAYHFNNGFNINTHLNVPVSGDTYYGTELSDYVNMQLLAGYRF